MNEIHVNDYGWNLEITIKDQDGNPKDLSQADLVEIILSKPNNSGEIIRTASFVNEGADGAIYYTIQDGDITEIGTWQIQVQIVSNNSLLRSNINKMKVLRNI